MGKISSACKAAAKKKFKVWPSAYASGWGIKAAKLKWLLKKKIMISWQQKDMIIKKILLVKRKNNG